MEKEIKNMRHFIILLYLCLFFQESKAGKDGGSLGDSDEVPSSVTTSPKPNPAYLQFSQKVKEASQKHEAYAFPVLLKKFRELELSEETWEAAAAKQSVEKWPFQSSWKVAMGAQIFLDAAINFPHQNLLRNGLRPLLSWVSEAGSLEENYAEATTTIHEIIQAHPYIRRRSALYALTAAAHLQHPLARLFLTEALRCYDDSHSRFFGKNHFLVKFGLSSQEGKEALHHFIDVPHIEAFVDLRDERDLKNPEKLREKAQLGLPHYDVLLGDLMDKKSLSHLTCPPEITDPIIGKYKDAADKGDFEGCLKVSNLMSGIAAGGTESTQPLESREQYRLLSAWYGSENAGSYSHIRKILEKANIPDTGKSIYKAVKRFLIP